MNYEISLAINHIEPNIYRLDVFSEPIPENFLGIGFDLVNQSEVNGLKLSKYELGPAFSSLQDGQAPMVLLKDLLVEQGRLVFGLTIKARDKLKFSNGKLVSFYFEKADSRSAVSENLHFEFERKVLSIFNQKRIDLKNVHWQGFEFKQNHFSQKMDHKTSINEQLIEKTENAQVLTKHDAPAAVVLNSPQEVFKSDLLDDDILYNDSLVQMDLNRTEFDQQKDFFDQAKSSTFDQYYFFLAILTIFLLICLWIRRFIKSRTKSQ